MDEVSDTVAIHRHNIRQKLKRKYHSGIGDCDVVAMFDHHRIRDMKQLIFQEHRLDNKKVHYAVHTGISDNVVELGSEVSSVDEGYDYAIAVVNKRTGELTLKPARLYKFEAKYGSSVQEAVQGPSKKKVDFTADNDIKADNFLEKRMALTDHFGSAKKIKIQEASNRRVVKNETLEEMVKTAFASATTLDMKADTSIDQITQLAPGDSSILPHANLDASLPRDIYPLSLFLNDTEIEVMKENCENHFNVGMKALIKDSDMPEVIAQLHNGPYTDKLAVSLCLLGGMVSLLKNMGTRRVVFVSQIDSLKFPQEILDKIKADFLGELDPVSRGGFRYSVSSAQKQRLQAFAIALALHISPSHALAITPWQMALHISAVAFEKLLQALGCDIMQYSVEEAARLGSIRVARLLKPPNPMGMTKFRKRR